MAYGSQLATNREGNVALGSRNHYDFTADPSAGEWEFSGPGGLPIECGIVLDTSTNTPAGSPVLSQNADRTNWGMALPPGTYSKIITATTHPTCVDDVADVLDAAGDSGYSVGVSGPNGSIFSAALVIGLAVAVLGVLLVSGLIVGVTVFVTCRTPPRWGHWAFCGSCVYLVGRTAGSLARDDATTSVMATSTAATTTRRKPADVATATAKRGRPGAPRFPRRTWADPAGRTKNRVESDRPRHASRFARSFMIKAKGTQWRT